MNNGIKIYTVQEVADLLHLTTRTIYKYIKEGKLTASQVGRKYFIKEEELKRLLEDN